MAGIAVAAYVSLAPRGRTPASHVLIDIDVMHLLSPVVEVQITGYYFVITIKVKIQYG
jgi:hypothetical protein